MTTAPIRVLVVDDHEIMLECLCRMLETQDDMTVISARDAASAMVAIADDAPDVVVMDVSLPDRSGIEATREVLSVAPAVRVIALSGFGDVAYVRAMVDAGARGYIMKTEATEELTDAVRQVADGGSYFGRGVRQSRDAGSTDRTASERS